MLNQSQTQNQPSYQSYPTDQQNNSYPKSQRKDSNTNNPNNSKYISNNPYQSPKDQRKSSNRERSRSNERSPRQSFHEYNQGNQNNNYSNINNRNSKPYHYRANNDRQFNLNLNKRESYSGGFNNNYTPSEDDCLVIFQKNYFEFNSKDFGVLKNELKRELKDDIYNIYYNYCINDISDKIFRFTTNPSVKYPCKSKAIQIICDFLFHIMKQQNDKVSYLKLIFVIPNNVVGFIIGMNGKNINQIRDETNTKIEVYSPGNSKNYRKIEISGAPQSIANASEKIFEISKRYFYFNNEKILNRNELSPQREKSWERDINRDNRDQGFGMNNYKDRERNERYHEGNWNRDYDNNANSKDFRGVYNRDRNDYRDMGYKNDYKNRDGNRMFGSRDYKNQRDSWGKDNYNYNNKDSNNNYRDYRNNSSRYKNNYDRGNINNRYYYKKNSNERDNNDYKNKDSFSERSFSKKSLSPKSKENRSYNNENKEDEWPEEKENNNEINNNDNQNLEPGEERDVKDNIDNNNNSINNINNNNLNENKISNENIENENAIDNNNDFINNIHKEENIEKKNEIEDINAILAKDDEESDKLCNIIICLSSDEINILNNTKNENDNIWISLEKSSHCIISKINKIIDDKEFSLITFNGTPKQNTSAIFQLQKYLSVSKNENN